MSFRIDKSVWEEAATAPAELRQPHDGCLDELDAEVSARIGLGAEGSGRYRRSAVLGAGDGGSASAVAGIPAAPSWRGMSRMIDADSGPIRLSAEILGYEEDDPVARWHAAAQARLEVDPGLGPPAEGLDGQHVELAGAALAAPLGAAAAEAEPPFQVPDTQVGFSIPTLVSAAAAASPAAEHEREADAPATSRPRRASGFIEVREEPGVAPPDARGDAAFAEDLPATLPPLMPSPVVADGDEDSPAQPAPAHMGFEDDDEEAPVAATASRSEGHDVEARALSDNAHEGEVEELDAEEAEIEEVDADAAHDDDPHAPEVAWTPALAALDEAPTPPPPPERGTRRPWYDEAFTEGHARLAASRDEDVVAQEVEFVAGLLGLPVGAKILDVGTGVGHLAIGLAKRGYAVTGVDASLAMLLEGSSRNAQAGNVASFLHGDMRRLPEDETYDAIVCIGQTFGYFDEADNRGVLAQMRSRLKLGGTLLLQVRSRDHMVSHLPCRSWWQGPRCLVLDEGTFDATSSRVRVQRTVVFEDGRQHEERTDVRVYAPHELVEMLGAEGMEVVRLFGSRLTPDHYFPSVSPEIWLLARRVA